MATDQQALLLTVSADYSRLTKQLDKAVKAIEGGSDKMERRAKESASRLEKFFGKTDPAKALDKVFDSTRFKIFDSATARIGLTGSALETLGPAGLVAAAGVGAVAAALAGAADAAKFADNINDTANRLHVTTDALQEYRYAIRLAGGEERGADEALEAFSANLGKAQEGLKKSQRAFLALGFTKEQIKGFADADTALKAVTERLQGLPVHQQDAIIEQLGLTGLKPLLESGVANMQRLRDEAHKVGIVMDAELVKRGGDLNDEFETLHQVIDVQIKSALIDLGPVLVDLLKFAADIAKEFGNAADMFKRLEDRRSDHLRTQRNLFVEQAERFSGADPISKAIAANANSHIDRIDKELASRATPAPAAPKPTRTLIDQSKTPKTPKLRDTTAERTDDVNAAVAQAARALLEAQGKLTDDINLRAETERQIAAQELVEQLARLKKQKDNLDDDKGISAATRQTLKAKLDEAATSLTKANEAKLDLIAREADWAAEDQADETRKAIRDAEIQNLEIAASLATTTAERRRIEEQILKIKQDELTHELGKSLSRDVQTGKISQTEADKRFEAGRSSFGAERKQVAQQNESAVDAFIRANRGADVFMEKLENIGVQGFENLADALAQAAVSGENLGDVLNNVLRQILAQVLSATIKSVGADIASAIFKVPAHAAGTNFAPGGISLVGERGPELVNLPRGSQVIPADKTLTALRKLQVPRAPTVQVVAPISFDLRGAVMTQELLDRMEAISRASEQRAVSRSVTISRNGAPARQAAYDALGT